MLIFAYILIKERGTSLERGEGTRRKEARFMAIKGTRELVKAERPGYLAPFEEMEKWFEEAWRRPFSMLRSSMWPKTELAEFETALPYVDIYEDGNELVMKADLPGMKKEDVDINITDNVLTVSGETKKEEKVEKGNYFRYERTHGSFFRRFELPYGIDTEKIKAHLEDGVLEIRLPRTHEAETKTKKISITG
jgi:HSP20 family protein